MQTIITAQPPAATLFGRVEMRPDSDRYLKFVIGDEADFWNKRKHDAEVLSEKILFTSQGRELARCANELNLQRTSDGIFKIRPFFTCKRRWCPVCSARKSKRMWATFVSKIDPILAENPDSEFAMLTLTAQNRPTAELREAVKHLLSSWTRLTQRDPFKNAVVGWVRSVEVTFNENECHPHIHVLLMLRSGYFSKKQDIYLKTSEWVRLWRKCAKLNYDPVCDVRKAQSAKGFGAQIPEAKARVLGALREVVKYMMKPTDLHGNPEKVRNTIEAIFQLKSVRMIAGGGLLKGIFREDDSEEPSQMELDHLQTVGVFSWWHTVKHYIKS